MFGTLSALALSAFVTLPARPPATVCSARPGCTVVKRIDVDGDGVRDRIAVRQEDRHALEVRVKTSRKLLVKRLRIARWDDDAYFGAARIDGVRGAEIVYADWLGDDFTGFKVLTYRNGRLVVEKPPRSRPSSDPGAGRWVIAGSYDSFEGITRTVRRHRAYITVHQGTRDRFGAQNWSGRSTTFVWNQDLDGWRKRSTQTLRVGSDQKVRTAYYGWHVKALPQV